MVESNRLNEFDIHVLITGVCSIVCERFFRIEPSINLRNIILNKLLSENSLLNKHSHGTRM